jgi:hypothetical protein
VTVNIAFKTPDALVFATDGLATLMDVDDDGNSTFLSNMAAVEKLLILSADEDAGERPVMAMFNGVGSLGGGTIATELRTFDREHKRGANETLEEYTQALAQALEARALGRLGTLPRPFHLVLAGFDGDADGQAQPRIRCIQWSLDRTASTAPSSILEVEGENGGRQLYGEYYAGVTEAVDRFVRGYDGGLTERLTLLLAGMGGDRPPGLLEQLAQEARAVDQARPLETSVAQRLARQYAYRIMRSAFDGESQTALLSEHFSLQSAIDYCVFLAQCAYARENLSPTRRGPPRVGSSLQVGFLALGHQPTLLAGIQLGIRVQGFERPGDE